MCRGGVIRGVPGGLQGTETPPKWINGGSDRGGGGIMGSTGVYRAQSPPQSPPPLLTRPFDGDLHVGDVLLVREELNSRGGVGGEGGNFLVEEAQGVGGQVFHVGVL